MSEVSDPNGMFVNVDAHQKSGDAASTIAKISLQMTLDWKLMSLMELRVSLEMPVNNSSNVLLEVVKGLLVSHVLVVRRIEDLRPQVEIKNLRGLQGEHHVGNKAKRLRALT